MGYVPPQGSAKGGAKKLSQLEIDTDKDWGGHVIKNLGAPSDAGDAVRLPVRRSDLEYPTEDVSFAYLTVINKVELVSNACIQTYGAIFTADNFSDKAIKNLSHGDYSLFYARWNDKDNHYELFQDSNLSTEDFRLKKLSGGSDTVLGVESVDLGADEGYINALSCSGSTIKAFREDLTTPKISVTDTDFTSGKFGTGNDPRNRPWSPMSAMLLAPLTTIPPAIVTLEAEIEGKGTEDEPFKPSLAHQFDKHSEFGNIDKYAVTWGAFDHKPEHATMLIVVTGDNPYQSGAIEKQIEHAKSKNLKVLKPPRDYAEAVEQYRMLKKDFPEWLAGKDNYAYQTLGHADIEPLAVADFYYGEVIDHKTHYDQIKKVPDWEMERTLRRWKDGLDKVTAVTSEQKEHHQKKLEEILKRGW